MRPQENWGGTLKETTLWTNSNPNNNLGQTNVTLSQSVQNFDVIRVYYKGMRTSQTEVYVDFPIETWVLATKTAFAPWMAISNRNSQGAAPYARGIVPESTTTIFIDYARSVTDGASTDTLAIPLRICGLK